MDFNKKYGSTDPKKLAKWFELDGAESVSYTHLTLPTNGLV